jgi:DNA repair exonuclease SbcCD ATPase subunit
MITIKNITMRNFLSVGAVTIPLNLDQHGLTLVLGANTDANGGLTRNGAGKTAILQAISFALYGKPLSKIKIPNLINNINGKSMLVSIEFSRGKDTYRIERGRKPDVMKFFVNNSEMKDDDGDQQGENRHTQEEIERVIGMSHTMFKHIVALNTYTDPFLRMPVANQREVIEELLGVTQISQRAEVLKRLIGETKESMRDAQAKIRATVEANRHIENAVAQSETLSFDWVSTHERTLKQLTEQIDAMEDIDYDAEIAKFDELDQWLARESEFRTCVDQATREVDLLTREISGLANEVSRYQREAETDVSAQIKRLETEKTRKEKDVQNMLGEIDIRKADIERLNADIAREGHLECHLCGQELEGTDHLHNVLKKMHRDVENKTKAIADIEAAISDVEADIANITSEIKTITETAEKRRKDCLEKAAAKIAAAEGPKARLVEQEAILLNCQEKLAALPKKPETIFSSRDEVYRTRQLFEKLVHEKETEEAKENPHVTHIDHLKNTLQEVDYEPLNNLDNLHKHQEFLLKLLTSKDSFIRKKIIDQNLNYLNSRLHYYLEKLGLPHEVRFQSDLSVDITLLGRDFDFEQLSRGEMNRVIMATSWSFRDVWESLNDTFNLMFVDEMLDQGTDGNGVEAALGILKAMARNRRNVFLISHRDDLTARIDRILVVRKENGFTRIEEEDSTL